MIRVPLVWFSYKHGSLYGFLRFGSINLGRLPSEAWQLVPEEVGCCSGLNNYQDYGPVFFCIATLSSTSDMVETPIVRFYLKAHGDLLPICSCAY